MAFSAISPPNIMTQPGALFIAPLGTAKIASTVASGVFSIDWSTVAAWLPLGATEDGSEFSYATDTAPIEAAEFLDPIAYITTGRSGSIAFALLNNGASNLNRAVNGGPGAVTATSGTGATALYTVEPPEPGLEVRCMIGWESLDHTERLYLNQTFQTGEVKLANRKAPATASIPCTFSMEQPTSGKPWTFQSAGPLRG